MVRFSRDEVWQGLPIVMRITIGSCAIALILMTAILSVIGFSGASFQYALAIFFSLVMTPLASFPLVVMSQRLQKLKAELEGLLRLDALTGIPNRRAFFERALAVFAGDGAVAAMMVDVDYFKKVNDTYGHAVGDVVLRSVAGVIKHIVEAAPRGGPRIAARLGGEEFGVLVENIGPRDAARLAQEIVEQMRVTTVVAGEHTIPVTVSVGLALRRDEETPDALMQAADAACYEAKRLGRNRCCNVADLVERYDVEALDVVCQLAAAG